MQHAFAFARTPIVHSQPSMRLDIYTRLVDGLLRMEARGFLATPRLVAVVRLFINRSCLRI